MKNSSPSGNYLCNEIIFATVNVGNMYRADGNECSDARPLRVILASADEQKKVLNGAVKLKSKTSFKDIFMNNDLILVELQQRNLLVAEKKKKQAEWEAAGQSASWVIRKGESGSRKRQEDSRCKGRKGGERKLDDKATYEDTACSIARTCFEILSSVCYSFAYLYLFIFISILTVPCSVLCTSLFSFLAAHGIDIPWAYVSSTVKSVLQDPVRNFAT